MAESDKAVAAVNYVALNINYSDDNTEHGVADYWMDPRGTLYYDKGDCEDMAFFVHSLLLNGSVSSARLRTYLGYYNGVGHAWVAYKRQSDDEWVILDATAGTITDVDSLSPARQTGAYANAWAYLTDEGYFEIPADGYLTTYIDNEVDEELPAFTMSGQGIWNWQGAVVFPSFTCTGFSGGRQAGTLPAFTAAATGLTGRFGSASFSLPVFQVSATGKTGTVGTLTQTWKALTCSATGHGVPVAMGSQSLPSFLCLGEGTFDRFDGYILRFSR